MESPTFIGAATVAPDTTSIVSYMPLPGLGALPVNAFVIRAAQPVLVDTGVAALGEAFLAELERTIDPNDLRWIWLSHMDADHVGNLEQVMARAPNARVVTSFLGMGKMMLRNFDVSRVHLLEPGAVIDAGDRTLMPTRPLYFDAPESMGFIDSKTRLLFAVDAFGAPLDAPCETSAALAPADLLERMTVWAGLDAPWLGLADRSAMGRAMRAVQRLDPPTIVSAHLPVAHRMTADLLGHLAHILDSGRMTPTATPDLELAA